MWGRGGWRPTVGVAMARRHAPRAERDAPRRVAVRCTPRLARRRAVHSATRRGASRSARAAHGDAPRRRRRLPRNPPGVPRILRIRRPKRKGSPRPLSFWAADPWDPGDARSSLAPRGRVPRAGSGHAHRAARHRRLRTSPGSYGSPARNEMGVPDPFDSARGSAGTLGTQRRFAQRAAPGGVTARHCSAWHGAHGSARAPCMDRRGARALHGSAPPYMDRRARPTWIGAARAPCMDRSLAAGRWPMADGRWPLADGRWPIAGGRWPVADGRWPMAGGRWPMAEGRWPLAAGGWPMAAGRGPMADGRWPLADGRWPMAAGRWPMADGCWLLAAG